MAFNPDIDGHVIWDYMHLMAANATTPEKREFFVEWMYSLMTIFPCEECRGHLIPKLLGNPVEYYSNTNISLLYYTWKLHDEVNTDLNKPLEQRITYPQLFEKIFNRTNLHKVNNKYVDPKTIVATAEEAKNKDCKSCGKAPSEIVKRDFSEFREKQRKTFMAKNSSLGKR